MAFFTILFIVCHYTLIPIFFSQYVRIEFQDKVIKIILLT